MGEHPILSPNQKENRKKTLSPPPSPSQQFLALGLFPFVCLSGDNGRLSITQVLTQICSVRRRKASGVIRISQPFTHETHLPKSELLASQTRFSRREQSMGTVQIFSLYRCREKRQPSPTYCCIPFSMQSNVMLDQNFQPLCQSETSSSGPAHTLQHGYIYQRRQEAQERAHREGSGEVPWMEPWKGPVRRKNRLSHKRDQIRLQHLLHTEKQHI